jgi:hypothetical protein
MSTFTDASLPASQQSTNIDLSDLLGANQAFLPDYDASKQAELIDAYCNKIGGECTCC